MREVALEVGMRLILRFNRLTRGLKQNSLVRGLGLVGKIVTTFKTRYDLGKLQ